MSKSNNNTIIIEHDSVLNDTLYYGIFKNTKPPKKHSYDEMVSNGGMEYNRTINDTSLYGSKPIKRQCDIVKKVGNSFHPVICSWLPDVADVCNIAYEKVKFRKDYYPDTDFVMLNYGHNPMESVGFITASVIRGIEYNSKNSQPFLVWNHDTSNINNSVLDHYLTTVNYSEKTNHNNKSSSLVVVESDGQIVAFARNGGILGLPCGYIEPFENPNQAAQRELFEETGIDCELQELQEFGVMLSPNGSIVNIFRLILEDDYDKTKLGTPHDCIHEGNAYWTDPQSFVQIESFFQSFNTVLLNNLNLL